VEADKAGSARGEVTLVKIVEALAMVGLVLVRVVVVLGMSVVALGRRVVVSLRIVGDLDQVMVWVGTEVGGDLILGDARMRNLGRRRRMEILLLVRMLKLKIQKNSGTYGKERVILLGTNKGRKAVKMLICKRRSPPRKTVSQKLLILMILLWLWVNL